VIGEEDVAPPIEKLKQTVRKRKQQRSQAQVLYKTNPSKTCKIGDGAKFETVTVSLLADIVYVDAVKATGKK
jgi:hypothetical protein